MKYKRDKNKLLQVRLSETDLIKLDRIAEDEKRTRSDVIRLLITRRVNNEQKAI